MENDLSFYSTAAQVLPVMLIILALELRGGIVPLLFGRSPEELEGIANRLILEARERRGMSDGDISRHPSLTPEEKLALLEKRQRAAENAVEAELGPVNRSIKRSHIVAGAASVAVLIGFVLAEAVALRALERGSGGRVESGIIESVMWLGGGLIAWQLIEQNVRQVGREFNLEPRTRNRISQALVVFLLAITYAVWYGVPLL